MITQKRINSPLYDFRVNGTTSRTHLREYCEYVVSYGDAARLPRNETSRSFRCPLRNARDESLENVPLACPTEFLATAASPALQRNNLENEKPAARRVAVAAAARFSTTRYSNGVKGMNGGTRRVSE